MKCVADLEHLLCSPDGTLNAADEAASFHSFLSVGTQELSIWHYSVTINLNCEVSRTYLTLLVLRTVFVCVYLFVENLLYAV